jgi:hypothetical protein
MEFFRRDAVLLHDASVPSAFHANDEGYPKSHNTHDTHNSQSQ